MFKQVSLLCTSMFIMHSVALLGDHPGDLSDADSSSIFSTPFPEQPSPFALTEEPAAPVQEPVIEQPVVKKVKTSAPIDAFTGRVKRNKVRLRLHPDTDSPIIKELDKGSFLSVVEDADGFWGVEAPSDVKAYVFRSFVLDNQIEGNRVNVRLQPNTEAPILAHLNSGDMVNGSICASSNKWLEITAPSSVRFYISKNFVENLGGPEVKLAYETKYSQAKQDLLSAETFAEAEMQKHFPSIDFDKMSHKLQTLVQDYSEFSDVTERAQECLAKTQEQYLDKRIAYLESKTYEEEVIATENKLQSQFLSTDKMKLWEPIEEALYLSWVSVNDGRDMLEYYEDQKLASAKVSGILECYSAPVKCKPGDYVLKKDGLPVGYLYSTKINLENYVGKKVTCVGTPRPNNNFAFPAYFVIDIEN